MEEPQDPSAARLIFGVVHVAASGAEGCHWNIDSLAFFDRTVDFAVF